MPAVILGKDVRVQMIVADIAYEITGLINSVNVKERINNSLFDIVEENTVEVELSLIGSGIWNTYSPAETQDKNTIIETTCPFCLSSPIIPKSGTCPNCGAPLGRK